ncbi:threonine aldolase [Catellatospora sp. TT07R-123]|uniref:threonine aldolase family protein n=1 Tax=Catellatospora sp. TT07R-123 TaxID=2733863 RepID=UPI001B1884E2|nr:beta-eliminating lyase-related protein [Catellatospora sp. TT07R-123]GHJ44677.1 threonine aldolase [Catellatospora sp. TT07R-123]
MTEDPADRRRRAQRGCDRILSAHRTPTMREQLALLDGLDLDGWPDFYGGGPVAELERRVAELLGKPAAVFFPTGTMAQQVALRCWAERTGSPVVALHPLSHVEAYERGAYESLSDLRGVFPTREPRQPTAAEVRDLDEPYGTLLVELPLREPGFLLPGWDELTEVVEAARSRGARVHFDGARLWESVHHWGVDLPTVAALADSVYVSLYKTLGGLAGAVVAGPADFVAQARAWRHRYGGNLFQQWPSALTALAGLDRELPRLPGYVAHAKVVAAALAQLPGAVVHPAVPHTHQFQLWLPGPADRLNEAVIALAEQRKTWLCGGFADRAPGRAMAEITVAAPALEWSADDVVEAGLALLALADPA